MFYELFCNTKVQFVSKQIHNKLFRLMLGYQQNESAQIILLKPKNNLRQFKINFDNSSRSRKAIISCDYLSTIITWRQNKQIYVEFEHMLTYSC